jgi:hypothetical protein
MINNQGPSSDNLIWFLLSLDQKKKKKKKVSLFQVSSNMGPLAPFASLYRKYKTSENNPILLEARMVVTPRILM